MDIEARLTQIEARLARGQAEQPEAMLRRLIGQMGQQSLIEWRPTLEPVIERFFPKRRRGLQELLDARISGRPIQVRERALAPAYPEAALPRDQARDLEKQLRDDLRELSERHIFQWATSYRDCLFRHFELFLEQNGSTPDAQGWVAVRRCLSEHSHEIFSKGYGHERHVKEATHYDAVQKSISGLVRFLDLPLDFYSVRATNAYAQNDVLALRSLFSAAAMGILEGYGAVRFADETGHSLLPRFSRRWGHNLAFLTPEAASEVAELVESSPLADGIERSVIPLLRSIDRLIRKEREDYFPIPLLGRFSWQDRLLEISVRAPRSAASRRVIETRAYLEGERAFSTVLTEARARNVALIVAPLRPHVREFVREQDTLAAIVVDTDDRDARTIVEQAVTALGRSIYSLRSRRTGPAISHNIAREFPLTTPRLMPFYRVERTSVRNLLSAFDRTNGARLWCSVRRSGKTTACFGLDFTAADSVIVSQTCGTGPAPSDRLFFERVTAAIETSSRLDAGFVETSVSDCSPVPPDGRRKVLIIDEYETLFGFLRAAAERDDYVRYTVVQPLLNQFVEFARENLLVLLGQQPDAHFILMDQNQLAPYVRQDPFPLFEHVAGSRAGEFGELVGKVFTDRIDCDPGFLGSLYDETAGHPFLTVNVLCALVDWLIEQKRPYRGLSLRQGDFAEFRKARLGPEHLAITPYYDFFRQAVKEAMGRRGYDANRWLFTVYWVLREIGGSGTDDLSIQRDDLADLMERIPAPGPLQDPNDILRTASQANFLQYDDDRVRVRIRTLGRLAAAVRPGLA